MHGWVMCVLLALAQGWVASLSTIQDEIANADGRGQFYDRSYRPAELNYWKQIPGWMEADAKQRKVARILDIGCGYGTLLALATQIYNAEGYCFDVADLYLRPAVREKYRLHFAQANVELDPIPFAGQFDVIIMTEVLEHFNFQPVPALQKIRAALAPEGRFFLSTPDQSEWREKRRYYQRLRDLPPPSRNAKIVDDHIWVYNKTELETVVKAAGFIIERLDYSPGGGNRHFNIILRRSSASP